MLTPEEYLASQPITVRLKKLGMTDAQLQEMQFIASTQQAPFDEWCFRKPLNMPENMFSLTKAYCALKWLILEEPPESRASKDAWLYVGLINTVPIYEIWQKQKNNQSLRAQKPRGVITEEEETIQDIIRKFALRHAEESCKEMWPAFKDELHRHDFEPEGDEDSMVYRYRDRNDLGRHITFKNFSNIVSKISAKKKSG